MPCNTLAVRQIGGLGILFQAQMSKAGSVFTVVGLHPQSSAAQSGLVFEGDILLMVRHESPSFVAAHTTAREGRAIARMLQTVH